MAKALTIVGAIPLVWFASYTLALELPRLAGDDPCFVWGQANGSTLTVGTPPCMVSAGGTSETKASAIRRLILVQGSMLASAALALIGTFTGRRRLCVAAVAVSLVLSVPLMLGGLGLYTLLAAACFFPSCLRARSPDRHDASRL